LGAEWERVRGGKEVKVIRLLRLSEVSIGEKELSVRGNQGGRVGCSVGCWVGGGRRGSAGCAIATASWKHNLTKI